MPLSQSHKQKISTGVKKYHQRAKQCFAAQARSRTQGTASCQTSAAKATAKRRVKPTKIGRLPGTSDPFDTMAQHATTGQRTTQSLLSSLPARMARLKGKDAAPKLAF